MVGIIAAGLPAAKGIREWEGVTAAHVRPRSRSEVLQLRLQKWRKQLFVTPSRTLVDLQLNPADSRCFFTTFLARPQTAALSPNCFANLRLLGYRYRKLGLTGSILGRGATGRGSDFFSSGSSQPLKPLQNPVRKP
jgi:hypothetical protein